MEFQKTDKILGEEDFKFIHLFSDCISELCKSSLDFFLFIARVGKIAQKDPKYFCYTYLHSMWVDKSTAHSKVLQWAYQLALKRYVSNAGLDVERANDIGHDICQIHGEKRLKDHIF